MQVFRKALVAGAVALACAGPAAAQWSGFTFFGDSLTDAGAYAPALPPGTGRFTTNPDPVWAQVLGQRYGFVITPATQGGTDYAYGGARVTLAPGFPAQAPTGSAVPIATQVTQATGRGIDPDAVYALWGGANDIFTQLGAAQAGTITSAQAQAAVALAAQQYVQQVGALQAAGARNIVVFNLPDIGRTPGGTAGGAAASAQISAITGLYNTTVQTGLDVLGGNVIRIDATRLFNEILANPSAYGFTNVTAPACGTTASLVCTPSNLVAANANQTYAFADGVHPTGAGHAVIASVVAAYLEGPFAAGTLTEGPLAVEQSTFRTVDGRMWSALGTPYDPQRGANLWVTYDYANPDVDSGFAAGDADLHTFSVGGDLRLSQHLLAGAAANFSTFKAAYTGGRHKMEETSATIYAGWGSGPWYAGVSALIGTLDYSDVARTFDIGIAQRTESGDTSGTHWGMRVHGGYWMQAGGVTHGPFAKLVWQRVDVNNFSERGTTSTSLRFGEQRRDSMIGSIGWQAQGSFGRVRPFGRVTWEHEFENDALEVTAGAAGLGGSYSTRLREPDDNWALINVGAAMDIGAPSASFGRITGFLMATTTAGKSDGDSWGVTAGLRVPF